MLVPQLAVSTVPTTGLGIPGRQSNPKVLPINIMSPRWSIWYRSLGSAAASPTENQASADKAVASGSLALRRRPNRSGNVIREPPSQAQAMGRVRLELPIFVNQNTLNLQIKTPFWQSIPRLSRPRTAQAFDGNDESTTTRAQSRHLPSRTT